MVDHWRKDEQACHQFLELIPKEGEWLDSSSEILHSLSKDQMLELSLGPPDGDWKTQPVIDSGWFQNSPCAENSVLRSPWPNQARKAHLAVTNQFSQPRSNRAAADLKILEKKAFVHSPSNTAVPDATPAHKRTAPTPVVGWPPVHSFRKNLANGSSSKSASITKDPIPEKNFDKKSGQTRSKSLFVKINMDGVPIGRKVDLIANDSYDKLSYAVDELFRGLLAAQCDSSADEERTFGTGLVNGNREYTLVYEDNEGDRMLVGDVPWHMFVSTVKRLRVLKSSELPAFSRGKQLLVQRFCDDS